MIATIALRYAGPGARLVARPRGVVHVYVGPLTPSGRFVPRPARTVCRARTRRLTVVDGSLPHERVCARCAVCLSSPGRRTAPRTRDQYRARFGDLTGRDLVAALADARTAVEVDQVAHLTLVAYGVAGCRAKNPTTGKSLHDYVAAARGRTTGRSIVGADFDTNLENARVQRAADRQAAREERDQQIQRIGIRNVNP